MTFEQATTLFFSALTQIVSLLVALLPLLMATSFLWLPILQARIKDQKQAQAFDVVSRAGLMAANAAAQEYRAAIAEAMKPDSPGGATVTEDEQRGALARSAAVGVNWIKDHKVYDAAAAVYGIGNVEKGKQAIQSALEEIVRAKFAKLAAASEPAPAVGASAPTTSVAIPVAIQPATVTVA